MKKRDLTTRAYSVDAGSFDQEARSIDTVIATEAPVTVFDWDTFREIDEVLLMSGCELPASRQVVMLDAHNRMGLEGVVGSTRDLRIEDGKLVGRNVFARTGEGDRAVQLVKDGHVTDNSIGYRVDLDSAVIIPRGQSETVQGRSYQAKPDRALRISVKWSVRENSLCPIGADEQAKMRMENDNEMKTKKQNDAERQVAIRDAAGNDIKEETIQRCIDDGLTVDQARAEFLEEIRVERPKVPHVVEDLNRSSFGPAMSDALLTRAGMPAYQQDAVGNILLDADGKPVKREIHGRAKEFVGKRIPEIFRECLVLAGVSGAREMSDRRAVLEGLKMEARAGIPSVYSAVTILSNTAGKSLQAAYIELEPQWPKFARRRTHNNFKEITRVSLYEIDSLVEVAPGGEYTHATIGDGKETYILSKFGKIFGITWEDAVNDNLHAFNEIPRKLARAARRIEDAIVFAVLTANVAMDDGVAVFHADHGNLGTGTISVASLDAAKILFRKQTSPVNESPVGTGLAYLNITPAVLVVPVAIEGTAQTLLESEYDPVDTNAKTANIWRGKLELCTHPVLDVTSAAEWYLSAGPAHGGIEMCFLDSQPGPYLEREMGFEIDCIRWKCRHVCAAAPIDHRALYKSSGT